MKATDDKYPSSVFIFAPVVYLFILAYATSSMVPPMNPAADSLSSPAGIGSNPQTDLGQVGHATKPILKSKDMVKPPYSYIALIAMAINR